MASNPPVPHVTASFGVVPVRPAIGLPLYLLVGLFYLMLLPEQANLEIGGVLLPPFRIFLIVTFLYLLMQAVRGTFRLTWPDVLIAFACGWVWLASYMTGSLTEAVIQGGAHTVDIGLAYLSARIAIRSPRDFRVFLILAAPGVAIMGTLVFLESISGRLIVQPLLAQLTGAPNRLGAEVRLGLTRGAASFPHPILAGIFLASFLPLYLMSGIRGWPRMVGAIGALGGFFTMSSAALLGLVMGAVTVLYEGLTRHFAQLNWRLFLMAMLALYAVVELTSNSGFFDLMARYASFNTVSAYTRVLIWEFGSQNVIDHPVFGIGYDDWERPSWMQWENSFSVDNFWLLSAMRFGLPMAVPIALATFAAVAMLAVRSVEHSAIDARLLRGVAIALALFALGAISVALWMNALIWFFVLLGMAVSLGLPEARIADHRFAARVNPPVIQSSEAA
jgi:hypothetical protein